jgi:hypothetical protein
MQGGWCWLEHDGPFWCHHQDCRDTDRATTVLSEDRRAADLAMTPSKYGQES